jgi:hypothetical protein
MKTHIKSFTAGFVSTFIFHQGLLVVFYLIGLRPNMPFDMSPNGLGVPSVISLAFFAGLWGILIWQMIRKDQGLKHWIKAFVYGAVGPTAVAFIIVFPLKGMAVPLAMIPFGLLINGVWGLGLSLLMKVMSKNN